MKRRWIAAWVGGTMIGVANGVAREATYGKRVSEHTAHQVSAVTAVAGFGAYFWMLQRRWPLSSSREAIRVGASWVVLTILFEFSFGRLVAKQSWEEMLSDYDLTRGRTWPLVLAWLAIGPEAVRRTQSP